MTLTRGPKPKVTVENSWLNKSLEERIGILRHVAVDKAEAISILVNEALKDEWNAIGPTKRRTADGVSPYHWKCDEPRITKGGP